MRYGIGRVVDGEQDVIYMYESVNDVCEAWFADQGPFTMLDYHVYDQNGIEYDASVEYNGKHVLVPTDLVEQVLQCQDPKEQRKRDDKIINCLERITQLLIKLNP